MLLQGEFRDGETIQVDADQIGYSFTKIVEGEIVGA
jgi:hypothetical protein